MAYRTELWNRLRYLTHRSRINSELSDEMQFHIECRAEELRAAGAPQAEALAHARREFGSAAKVAEDAHNVWRIGWLDDLISDIGYATRALQRNPGFAITAVFCLALGIGANTTIFSITTSFLFSLPSARDASSLISIWEGGNSAASVADYKFLRDAHVFEATAGTNPETEVNWRNGEQTSRLYAGLVTDDYFSALGVPLSLGRGIAPGETDTAVLSHDLWLSRFGGDPAARGRRLMLDGRPFTVVGVLPADHRSIEGFGFSPDIYVPAIHDDDQVQFYARMPRGMTIPQAQARLRTVFQELDRIRPQENWKRASQIRVTGVTGAAVLGSEEFGTLVAFFGLILAVSGLVLLIACTNVASLLLARASSRSGELAIRLSLGASRLRIVRHLLAEGLVLATMGAAIGFLITAVSGRLLSRLTLPLPVPIRVIMTPDWRLFLYAIVLVVLSTLLSGLMPALKAVRKDVNAALKREQGRTGGAWGLRGALVAGQLALSVVLLSTGFLFIHNLLRATSMNPGFDIDHAIWTYMRLVPEKYKDQGKENLLVDEALQRLRSLPGVAAAAITKRVPLNDNCMVGTLVRTDLRPDAARIYYSCNSVGPDYFRAIGIPILRGREFSRADQKGAESVAIVNETFARMVFGSREPVGRTITVGRSAMRIIAVARDSKYFTLGENQRPALYEPWFARDEPVNLHFIVGAAGSPSGLVKPIQEILGKLDPTAAIETKPMLRALGLALLPSQAGAAALGTMGMLGLILVAVGLYGGLMYAVSRRTREIGIRLALGATPAEVMRVVCRHTAALVGVGMIVGLVLAFVVGRPVAMFLVPGLSAADPASLLSVVGVLIGVALLATVVPAIRALRVDPMTALRHD